MNIEPMVELAQRLRESLQVLGRVVLVHEDLPIILLLPRLPGAVWAVTPIDEGCYTLWGGYGVSAGIVGSDEGGLSEIAEQIIAAVSGRMVEYLRLSRDTCESVGHELRFQTGSTSSGILTGDGVVAVHVPAWSALPDAVNSEQTRRS